MSTLESELARILQNYDEGFLSKGTVISELVELAGTTDVDAVVFGTPAFLRGKLIENLKEFAEYEGPYFSIFGGIWDFELEHDPVRRRQKLEAYRKAQLEEKKRFETIIRPRIRAWAKRRQ